MKTLLIAAIAASGFATAAQADSNSDRVGAQLAGGQKIIVSCYRGPQVQVYWDRANPEFYDSLRAAGYSPSTAHAIGDRICRDQSLVGNLEEMRAAVAQVIRTTPKDARRR